MATRLILNNTAYTTNTPAYDGGWANTTNAVRKSMTVTKDGSAMTSKAVTNAVAGELLCQLVSEPLSGAVSFTTSHTFRLQLRALSSGTNTNMAITIKVITSAAALRGTLYANNENATAFSSTTLTNRSYTGTCSAVSAQAGDRIVLEIGRGGMTLSQRTTTFSFGSDNATDLGQNDTDTTAFNPWLEFSNTFTFSGGGGGGTTPKNLMLLGVG